MSSPFDPTRDLVLERIVDVPPSFVWDAYTQPELLKQWFCPRPWRLADVEMDLRPGGLFRTAMEGPDGAAFSDTGCFLDLVPGSRLVWTSALGQDFRPKAEVMLAMTAIITIEPSGAGTRYLATVLHADAASREKHEAMGFHQGWSAAFDQLVALAGR